MSVKRTFLVGKLLKEKTNINNKLTINDIIYYLQDQGYNVSRNTVREDMKNLIDLGYKIVTTECRHNTKCYYYESEFSIEQCRVILDSLSGNKFINNNIKKEVKDKILANVCYEDRIKLKNSVRIDTISTGSIDVTKNLLILHSAISEKLFIDFTTTTRDINKEIKNLKTVQNFIPKEIYYYNDRYYLIGFNNKNELRNYRIDRILDIIENDKHKNEEYVNLNDYGIRNFDMFISNKIENIEFRVHNSLINSIIEKFGEGVCIHKCIEDDNYFILNIKAGISKGLIRWILKQGSDIKVLSPLNLIDKVEEEIDKIKKLYI